MASDKKPEGQFYSHVYIERGGPKPDSVTMRRRLAALTYHFKDFRDFDGEVPRELGVDVPYGIGGPVWIKYFAESDIVVVLNTITLAYRYLEKKRSGPMVDPRASKQFLGEVARIFAEENGAYQIDALGGVHPLVDPEFDANRHATIAVLRAPRYANVLDGVDRAQKSLSEIPADGKGAIRSTFAAAEGLFKLLLPRETRLTAEAVKKQIPSLVQRAYGANAPALRSASKLVTSLAEWVDSAHYYRHEQGSEEIVQPPFELAINLVSLANSFVRWLAELDEKSAAAK